jgi:phage/plasmid-associated DNA primase
VVGWLLARRELELAEDKLTNADAYRLYQAWCETAGEKPKSVKIMRIQLKGLGLELVDRKVRREDGSRFKVQERDLRKAVLDEALRDYIV